MRNAYLCFSLSTLVAGLVLLMMFFFAVYAWIVIPHEDTPYLFLKELVKSPLGEYFSYIWLFCAGLFSYGIFLARKARKT